MFPHNTTSPFSLKRATWQFTSSTKPIALTRVACKMAVAFCQPTDQLARPLSLPAAAMDTSTPEKKSEFAKRVLFGTSKAAAAGDKQAGSVRSGSQSSTSSAPGPGLYAMPGTPKTSTASGRLSCPYLCYFVAALFATKAHDDSRYFYMCCPFRILGSSSGKLWCPYCVIFSRTAV